MIFGNADVCAQIRFDIDAVGRIAAEINGITQQDCVACAQRSRTETAYILITDDVHFFGGKQIMRAILGIDLVMVAHDPFAQWAVLNQIALQGYRGIAFVERCVFGIFRKPLFHTDIVEPNAVWQDGRVRQADLCRIDFRALQFQFAVGKFCSLFHIVDAGIGGGNVFLTA